MSARKTSSIIWLLFLALAGCSQGFKFKTFGSAQALQLSSVGLDPVLVQKGRQLWSANCNQCHGQIDSSDKINSSTDRITTALTQQPSMLSTRSKLNLSEDVPALAAALSRTVGPDGRACQSIASRSGLRRLSRFEISSSFESLFGATIDVNNLPSDGFNAFNLNRDGITQSWTTREIEILYDTFSTALDSFILNSPNHPLFTCRGKTSTALTSCLKVQFQPLLQSIWRKTPTDAHLTKVVGIASAGEFNLSVKKAILWSTLSPKFLMVYYAGEGERPLTSMEIAERLALLLTGKGPDATLISAVNNQTLLTPEQLRPHVLRLLQDRPTRQRFLKEFVGQWLGTSGLPTLSTPVGAKANGVTITPDLLSSMEWEVVYLFDEFLAAGRSFQDLLRSDYTIATSQLASIYGTTWAANGAYDSAGRFARTSLLASPQRKGLLGILGVLTKNSFAGGGTEVNPILRGLWTASRILCRPPGPPPPDAGKIDSSQATAGSSLKQIFAEHAKRGTSCYSCHKVMDPIGFGLFNFGPFGEYRTTDTRGFTVDPSGELFEKPFSTANQMIDLIAESADIKTCFVSHLINFGTSKDVIPHASCEIDEVVRSSASIQDLIVNSIINRIFTSR